MELVRRVYSMKELSRQARAAGRRIGFVPTMGSLHEGHLSLLRRVKELADVVVVSIFVNPTQFGPGEDFDAYPRDLARDVDLCIAEDVDYVFAPSADEIYPSRACTHVEVDGLSGRLEGHSRPGHFRGVATVVLKLFHVVQPTIAAFGQKDMQQAVVIQQMVRDLMLDVEVLVLPTARDTDEVALSSRNRYLSGDDRRVAGAIPRALEAAKRALAGGAAEPAALVAAARTVLEAEDGIEIDYVELVDPDRLEPLAQVEDEMVLLVAAAVGPVRLLDNTLLRR